MKLPEEETRKWFQAGYKEDASYLLVVRNGSKKLFPIYIHHEDEYQVMLKIEEYLEKSEYDVAGLFQYDRPFEDQFEEQKDTFSEDELI